ncbi:MAG: homogentisate 1,2-dioxygenase [Thermoleophilia bacterium]|nr:homogentisate 1,2-dioxygenase [Thermoleophilia bacterium]
MPMYHVMGEVPRKRHTQFRAPDGKLYVEEVFGLEGFDGPESILYHRRSPARISHARPFEPRPIQEWVPNEWAHRHLRFADFPVGGDPVRGRQPFMFNNDITMWYVRPDSQQEFFYRNGMGDEIVFIHEGEGTLRTMFGSIPYGPGDYLVIPRGTIYQFEMTPSSEPQRHLVLETPGHFSIPKDYRNQWGQLLEHAPYYHRDLRRPTELDYHGDESGAFELHLRVNNGFQVYELDHHPFDVVGWDGYNYPFAFNIWDFEPKAGRLHQPPPAHLTFRGPRFVICSFMPRMLDWDKDAIVVPYHHSNLDSEEMLYYFNGNFASRKGIDLSSITLHPSGLPHGPQPGLDEKTIGMHWTDEAAVMVDTFRPLKYAAVAEQWDDPAYKYSWNDGPAGEGPMTVE